MEVLVLFLLGYFLGLRVVVVQPGVGHLGDLALLDHKLGHGFAVLRVDAPEGPVPGRARPGCRLHIRIDKTHA